MAAAFDGLSGNDGMVMDQVDLQNAGTKTSVGNTPASPAQAVTEAKLAKMSMFSEKPMSEQLSHIEHESKAPAEEPPDAKRSEPSDFYDWLMLSYERMRNGDPDGAWEAACKTLEYDTTEYDLFVPLCQQFTPPQRRKLANDAMAKTPGNSDAYQWLWVEVALSYWYEGNFQEAAAEYETILKQKYLDPCLIPMLYNSLAMCYEAMGRYTEAEQKYLEIDNREAVLKARARSGDLEGVLKLMKSGICVSEPRVNKALEATFKCCLGNPVDNLPTTISELLELEADWPYKDFMLGVMELVDSKGMVGFTRLERFLRICSGNPHEWGVTLRWEIGVANDVLAGFAG